MQLFAFFISKMMSFEHNICDSFSELLKKKQRPVFKHFNIKKIGRVIRFGNKTFTFIRSFSILYKYVCYNTLLHVKKNNSRFYIY
jgi:hypothetical protein